jgi:hypothetical protein
VTMGSDGSICSNIPGAWVAALRNWTLPSKSETRLFATLAYSSASAF